MRLNYLIALLATAILLLSANYVASRHPLRLDLTQNSIYTLSSATREILGGLDDVLTVRVYFSDDLPPALQAIRRDVDDLLDEYKGIAGSRIQVEHIDPASSALEEQKVAMMGIPALQVNVISRDRQEVAKVYLGMAVLYGSRQEVIPVVQGTGNLEYSLDEAIIKVSEKQLPRIAWLERPDASPDGQSGFSIMRQALSQRYDISEIAGADLPDLDPDAYEALVILSPRQLGEGIVSAIGGYMDGGGKVIALVDRFEIGEGLSLRPASTDLLPLLKPFGVEVSDDVVLDELSASAAFTGGVVTYHIPYPLWPDVRREGLNQDLQISSNLESVVMPWTSPLQISGDGAAVAQSSPASIALPGAKAPLDPKLAAEALKRGDHRRFVLASLLDGPGGSRLFLTGSSHWASDRFIPMFPQNAALFQNAVDYFAMGDLLIGVRSRESTIRPIAQVPYEAAFWFKYSNIAAGPLALGAIGLATLLLRRRRRARAVELYA